MLEHLSQGLLELPALLADRSQWDSLIVNRRKPWTYRVYSKLSNGMRVCLHRFEPCHTHEAHPHPHPWPGAFIVLEGAYKMFVGQSPDREQGSKPVLSSIYEKWSAYEIIEPLTWHSVVPLTTTYTVMVNDTPWPPEVAHTQVKTTKGKDLDKMPEEELVEHLGRFQSLVADYNARPLRWLK